MKDTAKQGFVKFWHQFFSSGSGKGLTQHDLAMRLGVTADVVNHWVKGRNAIQARNLGKLLEGDLLTDDETAALLQLWLRHAGFSGTSLFHLTRALGRRPRGADGGPDARPRLLVLSPFVGASSVYYTELLTAMEE